MRQVAFWLVILVVWSLGWLSWYNLRAFMEADDRAEQALEVRFETGQLLYLLKNAQAAERGFIITGDPAYLEPYEAAAADASQALSRLGGLMGDSRQKRRLDLLRPLVANRLDMVASNIEMRRSGRSEVFEPAWLERGRATMTEIRDAVTAIIEHEAAVHAERKAGAERRARAASWALFIGILVSTFALVGILYLMLAEVRHRRRAEAGMQVANLALQDANADLEDRVRARTAELTHANELLKQEGEERDQVTETLRESNEILSALFESSPFAIVALDPHRIVLAWNQAASRIFGYSADEVIGQPYKLVPVDRRAEFEQLTDWIAAGGSHDNVAVQRLTKDGRFLEISLSGAPLYDGTGAYRGGVFILEDVTGQKAVQRQLEHAQRMEAVGQLTGGMAHDFNNLLAVIIGNLDLIEGELAERPKVRALSQSALDAALRGAELSRKLLAFSRQQSLEPAPFDLNDLVQDTTDLLRRTLGEQIEFVVHPADDLWDAFADRTQVESALVNFAVNARDAMPEGGRLTIETGNCQLDADYVAENAEVATGDYVVLAVSDTGGGIPPDILKRVLEPFFTTKEEGKGTGLGLSMIYGFAKQSGGHIKIYSEVGHGTSVRLYLPRAATGIEAALSHRPVETLGPTASSTILVVEDNPAVRSVAVGQLAALGYDVLEADGPAAALQLVREEPVIDLLFTDLIMPGEMTGYDLARDACALRPEMRVLFTSGFAEASLRPDPEIGPAAPMLSKPYRKQELARKVHDVLHANRVCLGNI